MNRGGETVTELARRVLLPMRRTDRHGIGMRSLVA